MTFSDQVTHTLILSRRTAAGYSTLDGIKTHFDLSPVFKTPEEIENGSPLLLDMVEDSRVLFDRDDFFQRAMKELNERLQRLGARRIWRGNVWYWDLKPDYKQGEIFEI